MVAPMTSSSTRTASRPPAAIRCLHLNSRLGEMPCVRATNETDMPGCSVSSTSQIVSATHHRRQIETHPVAHMFPDSRAVRTPVDSESEEKVREKLIVFGSLTRPLTGGRGYSLVLGRAGYDYAAE
jgi:hypothetical protein